METKSALYPTSSTKRRNESKLKLGKLKGSGKCAHAYYCMYLDADGVEDQGVQRGDAEVEHGEAERLEPGDQAEELPGLPRRHHADAGVRLHQGHLDVGHPRPAAVLLPLRRRSRGVPRRVAPHVLRVREELRERGRRRVRVVRRGLRHAAAAIARRRRRRRGIRAAGLGGGAAAGMHWRRVRLRRRHVLVNQQRPLLRLEAL